jgi:DnaK suppressor protein
MAARKKVSKKSAARQSKKKVSKKVAKKKASPKKTSARKTSKKKPSKKKVAKKKVSKKKPSKKKAAKKKVAKKTSKKKPAKKKASGKKLSKAAKKKAAKKTPAKKKAAKTTSRKKVSKKKVTKKKVSTKKAATKKKVSKKKVTKKTVTKKAAAKKTSTKKKAAKKAPASKTAPESAEQPVKRKITISPPPVRRPSRIASVAPVNPADQVPIRPKRRRKVSDDQLIHGITPYLAEKGEEYMNPAQLEHFRNILTAWKDGLMQEVDRTVHHMQDEASNFPDPNDRATQESEFGLELRTRDRERKLLKKISQAIDRVDEGDYGYCEETGDEIGLKRLEARPVATLSVEAQERREVTERQYSDQDDRYR